jgi:large conductance mechanosensitive channel
MPFICLSYFITSKINFMGFLKEFKEFAMKGNIVDLAVAVIIGGAFGSIVSSLVDDIINPLILAPALKAAGAADIDHLAWGAVKYGSFLASIIKFVIVALALFSIIKAMNSFKKKEVDAPAPPPSSTDQLLMEIRDALKK